MLLLLSHRASETHPTVKQICDFLSSAPTRANQHGKHRPAIEAIELAEVTDFKQGHVSNITCYPYWLRH